MELISKYTVMVKVAVFANSILYIAIEIPSKYGKYDYYNFLLCKKLH